MIFAPPPPAHPCHRPTSGGSAKCPPLLAVRTYRRKRQGRREARVHPRRSDRSGEVPGLARGARGRGRRIFIVILGFLAAPGAPRNHVCPFFIAVVGTHVLVAKMKCEGPDWFANYVHRCDVQPVVTVVGAFEGHHGQRRARGVGWLVCLSEDRCHGDRVVAVLDRHRGSGLTRFCSM